MLDKDIELESWSYATMCMAEISNGKIVTTKSKKTRRTKCPLGKKIVGSFFFRSVVYNIDFLLDNAKQILDCRRRDLDEYNFYVEDEQVDADPEYQQELAREIVFWTRMVDLYQTIEANKNRWYKKGKFPWSGVKVSTPYLRGPSIGMRSAIPKEFMQVEFQPVTQKRKRSP